MNVAKVMNSLEYGDLMKIKKDIDNGAINLKSVVSEKIKQIEMQHSKSCASCSNDINIQNTQNFTLVFGPHDFRKRATFCGVDCLEYFMAELKEIKRVL